MSGVELDVVTDEGLQPVVVVAVSGLHSDGERVFGLGAGSGEVLGAELVVFCGDPRIGGALVE